MKIYLSGTANLGDFLNAMPVLSGLNKKYGKYNFIIRSGMRKFKGIKEFLMYQDLFLDVSFDDEMFMYGEIIQLSSWPMREVKTHPNRPVETCRYENWLKDHYSTEIQVDDDFTVKFPELNLDIRDTYYVGDRWSGPDIDDRRETEILSYLKQTDKFEFIDYNNDLLTNSYIIKNSKKPFITNFTGIGMLADLLNKECYVVWKPEDWKPEFRNGNNISWDNGKDINTIFEKHFYLNRKAKLVHANDLQHII